MQWVSQRPEKEVAVVCHSSILHFMLSNFARDAAPAAQRDLRRFFGELVWPCYPYSSGPSASINTSVSISIAEHMWCCCFVKLAVVCCRAANCELWTVTLSDGGSEGGLDPTWFHPDDLHKETAHLNGAVNGVLKPTANGML